MSRYVKWVLDLLKKRSQDEVWLVTLPRCGRSYTGAGRTYTKRILESPAIWGGMPCAL